jgi:hypothetical protein
LSSNGSDGAQIRCDTAQLNARPTSSAAVVALQMHGNLLAQANCVTTFQR